MSSSGSIGRTTSEAPMSPNLGIRVDENIAQADGTNTSRISSITKYALLGGVAILGYRALNEVTEIGPILTQCLTSSSAYPYLATAGVLGCVVIWLLDLKGSGLPKAEIQPTQERFQRLIKSIEERQPNLIREIAVLNSFSANLPDLDGELLVQLLQSLEKLEFVYGLRQ